MSTMNLSLDQHRLVVDDNGAVINVDENSFLIYDMISETVLPLPNSTLNEVAVFLLQKPTVILGGLPKSAAPTSLSSSDTSLTCVNSSEDSSLSSADSSVSSSSQIWIKNSGKPSAIDVKAREDLINLVKSEKYQMKLKDKKTTKKFVFEEISKELVKKGYSFGDREAWKVCQQKWKNMESETLKVLAAAGPKNTGGGQVKKPDYFDDVFDVVKDTAKACLKDIQDSLPEAKEVAEVDKGLEAGTEAPGQDEEEGNTSSPFLKVKVSSKPQKKRVNDVLDFIKEDAAKKDKQNEDLLKFLKRKAKAEDKRKKSLLSVLRDLAGSTKRKKDGPQEESTSSSSSDEEDSA